MSNNADKIIELKKMLDEGNLTQEEFEKMKKEIFSSENKDKVENNPNRKKIIFTIITIIVVLTLIFIFLKLTILKNGEDTTKIEDSEVISYGQQAVRESLKNPSSAEFLSSEILEKDEYNRYLLRIKCEASNSFGGRSTDEYYVIIRKADDNSWHYNSYLGVAKTSNSKELVKMSNDWGEDPNEANTQEDNNVEKTKEDGIITTFYEKSYYMYVYVSSEQAANGFYSKLNEIGSTWIEQYDGEKYILYVKKDNYNDVYSIISKMEGVTRVEKTEIVVKKDNEIINGDNKYVMQVFAKIGEVTSREFYNLCSDYGEVVDGYTTEDMYVEVILVEENKYDEVYNELSQNNKVERIINDKQTLEDYKYYAGME